MQLLLQADIFMCFTGYTTEVFWWTFPPKCSANSSFWADCTQKKNVGNDQRICNSLFFFFPEESYTYDREVQSVTNLQNKTFSFLKNILGLLLACLFLELSISHVSESSKQSVPTVFLFSHQNGKKLSRFLAPNSMFKSKQTSKQTTQGVNCSHFS